MGHPAGSGGGRSVAILALVAKMEGRMAKAKGKRKKRPFTGIPDTFYCDEDAGVQTGMRLPSSLVFLVFLEAMTIECCSMRWSATSGSTQRCWGNMARAL